MEQITYAFPKLKNVDPSCYIDAYNLILECSQAHSPRGFSMKLLELLDRMCPYDSAVLFFLDSNRKICGKHAVGIRKEWLDAYVSYYLDVIARVAPDFNIYIDKRETSGMNFNQIIDWSQLPPSEFKSDYIDALGLKYSWGFCFFDLIGAYRVIVSLDRTRPTPFSEVERNRLGLALPILNNMHRNFFYQGMDTEDAVIQSPWASYHLTARESEIADLLCQGMKVQNISSALYIAVTTTYKHISHIFEKVGVSSQRELIARLLNKKMP